MDGLDRRETETGGDRAAPGGTARFLAALCLTLFPAVAAVPPPAAAQDAGEPPRRIVSLAPNLTEMLFAIGAGGQVVGVTDYCDHPPEARRRARVGGYVNPNPETVVSLAPDLVVATPNVGNRPFVERLMRLGVRVEIVQARNLDEIFPALDALGRASGHAEAAAGLSARLRRGIDDVREKARGRRRPRALLCIQIEPLIVAGAGSYPHDLLALAGGGSIVPPGAGAYPRLSLEEVIRAAPEVIVQTRMDTRPGGTGETDDASLVAYWKRWPSLPAVSGGRVHSVPGDALLRPGPRVLEGLGLLFDLLHGGEAGTASREEGK